MSDVVSLHTAVDAPVLSRRERRKQEVRGRISEAALALFARQGCEVTTVEEICEAAEVARKTFYNYYDSKQALIRELSDSMLYDETSNLVEMAIEKFGSTRERLEYFFSFMASNLERYEDLERSLIQQTLVDLSAESSRAGEKLGMLNEALIRLMEDGRRLGDVSHHYSTAFMGEMVVGAMNAVVMNWIHNPSYPLFERIEELTGFLYRALLDDA